MASHHGVHFLLTWLDLLSPTVLFMKRPTAYFGSRVWIRSFHCSFKISFPPFRSDPTIICNTIDYQGCTSKSVLPSEYTFLLWRILIYSELVIMYSIHFDTLVTLKIQSRQSCSCNDSKYRLRWFAGFAFSSKKLDQLRMPIQILLSS
jgi:hypothetical protein